MVIELLAQRVVELLAPRVIVTGARSRTSQVPQQHLGRINIDRSNMVSIKLLKGVRDVIWPI